MMNVLQEHIQSTDFSERLLMIMHSDEECMTNKYRITKLLQTGALIYGTVKDKIKVDYFIHLVQMLIQHIEYASRI